MNGIDNSLLFQEKLRHALKENPANALLRSDGKKPNTKEDVVSIVTAVLSLAALAAGVGSYLYVSNRGSSLRNSLGSSLRIVKEDVVLTPDDLDVHYVGIQTVNTLQLTLPNPSLLDRGRFVSVYAARRSIDAINNVSSDPTPRLTVKWTNSTEPSPNKEYSLTDDKGALFMITSETLQQKWKLVRTWSRTP